MSVISIPHRVIEVGYKSEEQAFVSQRVIEVAWRQTPMFSMSSRMSSRVIEVAYLRAGRIYGVAIGHF